MVHARAKKAKGDEAFQARKQKVGRKKLAPATATRAEVHARTLRVQARATPTVPGDAATATVSAPTQRSFTEDMTGTRHYKEGVRKSAFESLFDAAFRRCCLGPVQRLQLVIGSLDALTDTDAGVRHEAVRILQTLLAESRVPDPSIAARILDACRIAMTHATGGVRQRGCEVLQALVLSWPGTVKSILAPGEGAKLLQWAADVATGHVASLPALEALVQEVSGPAAACLSAPEAQSFYDRIVPWLATLWKESVELQGALFRSAESSAKAMSCGRILALLSVDLHARGTLSKAHMKRLRELMLFRVPLSMREMSSAHNEHSRGLALVIAEACVPIAAHYDDAFRAIASFVTVSIASLQDSSLTSLLRIERLVLQVLAAQSASLVLRLVDTVPALLSLVIRSASPATGGSQLAQVFGLAVEILKRCCDVDGYSSEALSFLAGAVDLTPRLLFASRRLPQGDADRVAHETLRLLWRLFSSRHDVLRAMDVPSLDGRLQAVLFGFERPCEGSVSRVAGILPDESSGHSTAMRRLASHLAYYIEAWISHPW
jgi:hypothetical protein